MTYYYEELVRRRRRAFGLGVLAGALGAAVAWSTLWVLGWQVPGREPEGTPVVQPEVPALTTEIPVSRLESCQEVFDAQTLLLETTSAPLKRWRRQIDVTNKLVTGVLTLEQGLAFWDRARLAALEELERYHAANGVFEERTERCPAPDEGAPSLLEVQCSRTVATRDSEVAAAQTALESWQEHAGDLDLLRTEATTFAEASQVWLTTWRTDVAELSEYRAAARAAEGLSC